jgi:hypothetical protein
VILAWTLALWCTWGGLALSSTEGWWLAEAQQQPRITAGSPLFGLLLQIINGLGPPADTALRLLNLLSIPLGAATGFWLCRALAKRHRSDWLTAWAWGSHGAILVAGAMLSPVALVWAGECLVLLLALRQGAIGQQSRLGLALLCLVAVVTVATLPATVLMVVVVAGWLGWYRHQWLHAVMVGGAATATLLVLAGHGLVQWPQLSPPSPLEIAHQVVGLVPLSGAQGEIASLSLFWSAAAWIGASVLALLALVGIRQATGELRLMALGLALPGLVAICAPAAFGEAAPRACLIAVPLLLLAAQGVANGLAPGDGRRTWQAIFVGLCLLSAARVLTTSSQLDTREVAAGLAQDEQVIGANAGLLQAVAFYRQQPQSEATREVLLWQRGDQEPRRMLAQALGQRLGGLWLVRPGQPVYDLGLHLDQAQVTYHERGQTYPCPWRASQQHFFCDGPAYQYVTWTAAPFDGVTEAALVLPPLDDGILEVRWSDVPLGRRLVGLAGIDDASLAYGRNPVNLEVSVADHPPLRLQRGDRAGLLPFNLETGPHRRGDVTFRVTTADDRGRTFFVDAVTLP